MAAASGGGSRQYEIDPLPVRGIPHGRCYFIIGKRNTGKTTLLVDLLFHRQNVLQFGIVIAGSIGSVVVIRKFHPDTFLFEDFDPKTIAEFWQKVKQVNGRLRRRGLPMVNFYIVLDDTGFDQRMWNDVTLKAILMNGRQYNLDVYICMQYLKAITASMREQCDYAFIFKSKTPENMKKIYDTFAGGYFESKFLFDRVFNKCTQDRRTLVIRNSDNNDESGPFEGGVFFYKARIDHREFTIGCDAMWRFHYRQYNAHYESDEEAGDQPNDVDPPRKRSEMTITLRKPKTPSLAKPTSRKR